ncbi:MAG TPA: flagellar basal body-associated FliL family protein [Noviherbaspirillum sp.]|nr:flagellar basal body-associated FliL family protein [Noviherbaspirillum sp.]
MSSKAARDNNLVVYSLLIVTAALAIGYAGAWWYRQHMEQLYNQVAYTPPLEIAITNDDYSMAAKLAIKTSAADSDWARQARRVLEDLVRERLGDADPKRLLAPNGLKAWQEALRDESNVRLHTDKVQEVLITDFVFSSL